MDFTEFEKSLSQSQPEPIYHLTGEEDFLIKRGIADIEKAITRCVEEFAGTEFYEAQSGFSEAFASLFTDAMFGDAKLVVITDLQDALKSSSVEKKMTDSLGRILARPPKTAFLVITSTKLDRRTKFAKTLSEKSCEVTCDPPKPYQMEKWVQKKLRDRGIKMTPDAVNSLMSRIEGSMGDLENELDKLELFAQSGGAITAEDISLLIEDRAEEPIYLLYNALGKGSAREAHEVLHDVLKRVESPIQIVAGLSRHLRRLLLLAAMREKGMDDRQIQSGLGVSSFQLKKMKETSSGLNQERLRHMLKVLEEADGKLKSGSRDGSAVMHQVIASIG